MGVEDEAHFKSFAQLKNEFGLDADDCIDIQKVRRLIQSAEIIS
jgi:hypothetical protein